VLEVLYDDDKNDSNVNVNVTRDDEKEVMKEQQGEVGGRGGATASIPVFQTFRTFITKYFRPFVISFSRLHL
jgi:hypothetical protein